MNIDVLDFVNLCENVHQKIFDFLNLYETINLIKINNYFYQFYGQKCCKIIYNNKEIKQWHTIPLPLINRFININTITINSIKYLKACLYLSKLKNIYINFDEQGYFFEGCGNNIDIKSLNILLTKQSNLQKLVIPDWYFMGLIHLNNIKLNTINNLVITHSLQLNKTCFNKQSQFYINLKSLEFLTINHELLKLIDFDLNFQNIKPFKLIIYIPFEYFSLNLCISIQKKCCKVVNEIHIQYEYAMCWYNSKEFETDYQIAKVCLGEKLKSFLAFDIDDFVPFTINNKILGYGSCCI